MLLVKHEFPLVNPCWLLPMIFFLLMCLAVVSRISCFITFLGIDVRLTSLWFPGKTKRDSCKKNKIKGTYAILLPRRLSQIPKLLAQELPEWETMFYYPILHNRFFCLRFFFHFLNLHNNHRFPHAFLDFDKEPLQFIS